MKTKLSAFDNTALKINFDHYKHSVIPNNGLGNISGWITLWNLVSGKFHS